MGFFYCKREKHSEVVVVRDEFYGKKHLVIGGANAALRYVNPNGNIITVLYMLMIDSIYAPDGSPCDTVADFGAALDDLRAVMRKCDMLHDWPLMRFIERHPGLTLHLCTDDEWDIEYSDSQRTGKKNALIQLDIDDVVACGENGIVIPVEEFVAKLNTTVKYNVYRKDFPDVSMGHNAT